MDLIFIEIPEFINKFDKIASPLEMMKLQDELIKNPEKGNLVKGTGGARKIRMKLYGKGKSGGARVIYYYVVTERKFDFLAKRKLDLRRSLELS